MTRLNVGNIRHPDATTDSITLTSGGDTQITGALGLGGATYGSSGQVLTSQGSGSAPQWATPSAGLTRTQLSSTSLSGNRTTLTGIASDAVEVNFFWENLYTNNGNDFYIQFGTSAGISTSGYETHSHISFTGSTSGSTWATSSLEFTGAGSSASSRYNGLGRCVKRTGNDWYFTFWTSHENVGYWWMTHGMWSGPGAMDRVSIAGNAGNTFSGGTAQITYLS